MIVNKSMIDLIKEIRRRCEPDIKQSIKLANPDVIDEILVIFHQSDDIVLRTLVEKLCLIAGSPWREALTPSAATKESAEQVNNEEQDDEKPSTGSIKMYRGAIIK